MSTFKKAAFEAADRLYRDTSVSRETILSDLWELREHVDMLVYALEIGDDNTN